MSEDLADGIDGSPGHPVVLLVLNVAFSVSFASILIYASDLANVTTFAWEQVGAMAVILIALTYVVTSE
ncbi:hypothetical protein [Halovivax limisalsi]|uniref:hypothetical protein n=1 Tax=Halovivax limisalsi TaxID=1453760 RepID=UPI001FFC91B7|nr:hypothetical protein [Halovivax limisalsi]